MLVVDDNSPDGTGAIADTLGAELGRIDVLHRPGKHGSRQRLPRRVLGTCSATDQYDVVISMDADLSHDPSELSQFIQLIDDGADVVIGSRYVPRRRHDRLAGAPPAALEVGQRVHPHGARRVGARLHVSGYRAYRATSLAAIEPTTTTAEGYAFLTELVRRLTRDGATDRRDADHLP